MYFLYIYESLLSDKFCMFLSKVQENYGNLRDVDVPSKTSPAQDTWVTLCIVIDRIAFFIFIVLVGVAYYLRY